MIYQNCRTKRICQVSTSCVRHEDFVCADLEEGSGLVGAQRFKLDPETSDGDTDNIGDCKGHREELIGSFSKHQELVHE